MWEEETDKDHKLQRDVVMLCFQYGSGLLLGKRQCALWREALGTLPITAADAIAHGNAERLWKLPRVE
jgi:hypothetical protein